MWSSSSASRIPRVLDVKVDNKNGRPIAVASSTRLPGLRLPEWLLVGAAAARESGVRGRVAKWFAVAAAATSTRLALAVFVVALAPAEASGVFTDKAGLQAAVNDVATAENTHGPLAW